MLQEIKRTVITWTAIILLLFTAILLMGLNAFTDEKKEPVKMHYVVQPGDTMTWIVEDFENRGEVMKVENNNSNNPNNMYPGDVLTITIRPKD